MKKSILTVLVALIGMMASAQTYRDSVGQVAHDTTYQVTVTSKTTHDSIFRVLIPVTDTLIRIMYVNATNTAAADPVKVNAMIKDLNFLKITHTFHYSISATSNPTAMANLFTKTKTETKVATMAPAVSGTTEINRWVTWNGSHTGLADVEAIALEFEEYNQTDFKAAWNTKINLLQTLNNLKNTGTIKGFHEYKGWWTSSSRDLTPLPTQVPDTMVKYFSIKPNLLLVHDYRVKPEWPYLEKRYNDLEASGKESGKVISTVVLFSAEPNFMGPWLAAGHTLEEAFWIIHAAFKAKNYKYVKLVGWACFHLDFWRAHQPTPAFMVGRSMKAAKPIFSKNNFKNKTTRKSTKIAKYDAETSPVDNK